ncbi:MAG: tetratricopeptide repeat protein [Anaerolineae bacterium]|nr:tetratricopeptide repeat protein [Anaerolineae bacterium]
MTDSALPDFDALWDYAQPAQTEQKFHALLPVAVTYDDASYLVQLYTQIARAQGLQQHLEEAQQTLDELIDALLEKTDRTTLVRYLLERGRVLNTAGQPDHAKRIFIKAWDVSRFAHEDFHGIDAAHMVAITEQQPARQLIWHYKALDLAENSRDPRSRRWLAALYNNLGWSMHEAGQFAEALNLFENALKFHKTQGNPAAIRQAQWAVGRTQRSMGRFKRALNTQMTLLDEYETAREQNGYVYEEIAESLLLLKREDEARGYFAKAYTVLSQDAELVANEPARLERLQALAQG